jgi:hypothetical protein
MGLFVSHLNLYSQKPKELAHFFSELLDMDILPDKGGDGIWVENHDLKLFINQASADQLFHKGGERDLLVEFKLDTLDELEDLLHKVHFLSYRQGTGEEPTKPATKAKLSKVGNKVFFNILDPDGRRWKFCFTDDL